MHVISYNHLSWRKFLYFLLLLLLYFKVHLIFCHYSNHFYIKSMPGFHQLWFKKPELNLKFLVRRS